MKNIIKADWFGSSSCDPAVEAVAYGWEETASPVQVTYDIVRWVLLCIVGESCLIIFDSYQPIVTCSHARLHLINSALSVMTCCLLLLSSAPPFTDTGKRGGSAHPQPGWRCPASPRKHPGCPWWPALQPGDLSSAPPLCGSPHGPLHPPSPAPGRAATHAHPSKSHTALSHTREEL